MRQDWSGKIVIDVTNAFMLPPEVQQAEYQGGSHLRSTRSVFPARRWSRPSINCHSRFSQAPCAMMSVDESYSSRTTMRMRVPSSRRSLKALALRLSKLARSQKAAALLRRWHLSYFKYPL